MRRYGVGKRIGIGILCALVFWGCGRDDTGEGRPVSGAAQEPAEEASDGTDRGQAAGAEPAEEASDGTDREQAVGAEPAEEASDGTDRGQATAAEPAEEASHGTDRGQAVAADIEEGNIPGSEEEIADKAGPEEPGDAGQGVSAEPSQVTLVMVGDILLHTRVAESGETEEGGYAFEGLFSHVKEEISQTDLALVNQEVIIGGAELGVSGYPAFNAPYELGDALADSGFDVILHATNHALDKGKKGLLNCLDFWEENYPEKAVLGIHESQEDSEEIYIYEQDGIRIAILNYTYGTNGIALPKDMPYAVDLLEEKKVAADLQRAEELADFTVVCPHWGTEYSLKQTKAQERWTSLFVENGADLVIGTHPHVIEPVEWVGDTLVYYSLGNFVNWTSGRKPGVANRMVGGMAQVTIAKNEEGVVEITDWGIEPLVSHLEKGFGGVTVYLLEEYTAELAERNEIKKQDPDFSLEYCQRLAEEVFGALWQQEE